MNNPHSNNSSSDNMSNSIHTPPPPSAISTATNAYGPDHSSSFNSGGPVDNLSEILTECVQASSSLCATSTTVSPNILSTENTPSDKNDLKDGNSALKVTWTTMASDSFVRKLFTFPFLEFHVILFESPGQATPLSTTLLHSSATPSFAPYAFRPNETLTSPKPLPELDSCGLHRPHTLVITSKNRIYCVLTSSSFPFWTTLDLSLSSIPLNHQVLAMHAFERTTYFNFSDIVSGKRRTKPKTRTGVSNCILAVTTQSPDNSCTLQIYGTLATGTTLERRLFALASDCQILPLHFKPLALARIDIHDDRVEPSAILVSGEGGYMWMFAEMPSTRKFVPMDLSVHFPALSQQKKTALCITPYEFQLHQFLAIGYEDGQLLLVKSSKLSEDSDFESSNQVHRIIPLFFTPVTSIQFFHNEDSSRLSLLATSSAEPSLVLHLNPSSLELLSKSILPYSDLFDSVLCSLVLPSFATHGSQLLLGTFKCFLLNYHFDPVKKSFFLFGLSKLPWPIYSLHFSDLNADGIPEILIASAHALHLFQYNMNLIPKLQSSNPLPTL